MLPPEARGEWGGGTGDLGKGVRVTRVIGMSGGWMDGGEGLKTKM